MNGQTFTYETVITEEDGRFLVSVPDLKGCHTEGDTLEEALANAKEAIEVMLESLEARGLAIPRPSFKAYPVTIRVSA